MRKTVILCLCLAAAFSVTACQPKNTNVSASSSSSAATSDTTKETAEPATSEDTTAATAEVTEAETTATTAAPVDVNVTAEMPDGWEPVEGSVAILQYMKNTSSFIVTKEKYFKSTNLDEIVTEAKDVFSKSFDKVVYEGDPETLTVAGQDARQIVFTCDISDMAFKYRIVYVSVGGNVFSFLFADLPDSFDSMQSDYDAILAGIQFS
jgi:hypothetical protein